MNLTLSRDLPTPLIEQIVTGIARAIDESRLRAGQRMPSVRRAATAWAVSRNSVVEAYDRLVATGYLQSVRGSGFYVRQPDRPVHHREPLPRESAEFDAVWMLRFGASADQCHHRPGWGGLPADWLNQAGVRKALRDVSRREGVSLTDYAHPAGSPELRMQLHRKLEEIGVHADPGQILTTNGVSHGLDLVARLLLKPGDTVLVDDPGYYTLFALLRTLGIRVVGIPRDEDGPDLQALERALSEHLPKAYFIITVLHNPTGTCIPPACAHQLLRMAEQAGVTIVEDDIYGDFHPDSPLRLAALDGLRNVVYINSFSKSMSSALRLGYIAADPELVSRLMDLKLVSTLTTSAIAEQVLLDLLASGQYRRFLSGLRARLDASRRRLLQRLEGLGFDVGADSGRGMYVWARLPDGLDAREIAQAGSRRGVLLAPGHVFRAHGEASDRLRFNVACSNHVEIYRVLEELLAAAGRDSPRRALPS
jgi:DNA-binding transcriptional MocR family regulator